MVISSRLAPHIPPSSGGSGSQRAKDPCPSCLAFGLLNAWLLRGVGAAEQPGDVRWFFVLLSCPGVPVSEKEETLVFPQAVALLTHSSAEPLHRFLRSGSPWEGESIEPHVIVKGQTRKSHFFPQDLGFWLGLVFFSTSIGRECDDRLTAWPGLAASPTLPLTGRAQALRFPPSAGGWRLPATFLLAQKKRKNCSPCGQMADCFLAAPLQCPFSYCPDKHTRTHTPTESGFPPGKNKQMQALFAKVFLLWNYVGFFLMMSKSVAGPVLPGPALCWERLNKGMVCCAVVERFQ